MKILIVIPDLCIGGTNRTLYNTLNYLNKEKFDVSILPMSYLGETAKLFQGYKLLQEDAALSVTRLTFKSILSSDIRMALKRGIKKFSYKVFHKSDLDSVYYKAAKKYNGKYDVVIGFQEGYATQFAACIEAPRRIAWVHCDYSNYKRMVGNRDESQLYARYDNIVCVSHYTASVFARIYPALSDRTLGIHNIMDDQAIFQSAMEKIKEKRFLQGAFTLVSVGRVSAVKRFSSIPGIAAQMLKNGCKFRWYIIGTDGDDSERMSSEIQKHNVGENVVFLGPKENPYPYIASSDVLVCLSYSEACPNVVNEAKILHVPVVAADFPTAVEFIKNEENGMIVQIDKMAEKLTELCLNDDRMNRLKKGIADFSYDNSRIISEIEQLLAETRPS